MCPPVLSITHMHRVTTIFVYIGKDTYQTKNNTLVPQRAFLFCRVRFYIIKLNVLQHHILTQLYQTIILIHMVSLFFCSLSPSPFPTCPKIDFDNKTCVPCEANCASCLDRPDYCTSCQHHLVMHETKCYSVCPPHTFEREDYM